MALTLDAGASAAPAASMLATLADRGVRTTFFLTGRWSEQNPALVQAIHAAGHEISNHSYSHPDFRTIDDARIEEEITRTERIIIDLTGVSTRPWFRFPYGARDARTRAVVDRLGFTSVFWTLDSLDSVGEVKTPEFLRERVVTRSANGYIVLMHIGSAPTAAALPAIIDGLRDRGFRLVTVSEVVR